MSVRMTNCGDCGWYSDKSGGYRYEPRHPLTREPWPPIPAALVSAWERLTGYALPPQACLVNVYGPDAKMGLQSGRDEKDFDAPILSVSLGADVVFRVGGRKRRGQNHRLRACRLPATRWCWAGGAAGFHGVDKILSTLTLSPFRPSFWRGARASISRCAE